MGKATRDFTAFSSQRKRSTGKHEAIQWALSNLLKKWLLSSDCILVVADENQKKKKYDAGKQLMLR
jgi:hypothetical protein